MAVTRTAIVRRRTVHVWLIALLAVAPAAAQEADSAVVSRNDSITISLVDVDLRAAVQALSRFLDRPVVFSGLQGQRVTLETPAPVPRASVLPMLRGVLESQNLELVADSTLYRIVAKAPARSLGAPDVAPGPPRPQGTVQLYVIRLSHARASDVAATVNALYGRASAVGELGARPSTLDEQLRQQQVPPAEAQPPQAVAQVAGRPATLTGDVTIVPDPSTNALLIRATPADFELIQAAVQQVDIRPLQVLIEVLIAEVRRDKSWSFGVGADLPSQRVKGTTNTTIGGSTTGLGLGDLVLRIMNVGGVDLDATLTAAAANGEVAILSRPVVLATNNESAEILVGSQRPFVQVQRTLPTDDAVRDQIVQYKDVGTRLVVRPTISADGYVTLEVTQEVNSATAETQFDAPIISTRTVSTRLLIKDGQTIVLGGLSDRQRDRNQGGVPVLSSIPVLGGLFGRASRRSTETELFLFITPRVLRTDDDAEQLTVPLIERAKKVEP